MIKCLLPGILLVSLAGCSNYSSLVKKHKDDVTEARIRPMDSASHLSGKSFRIRSVELEADAMPPEADFVKTKTLVLPFLVFDYWDHRTEYVLGRKQFKVSIEDHLKSAFEVGLSQFGYRGSESGPDFEISIKARKIKSKSTYTKSGFFYFALVAYGFHTGESRGPYASSILLDVTTHSNGKSYTSEVEGNALLPLTLFNDETDSEIERISRSLAISVNDAVAKYALVAPK